MDRYALVIGIGQYDGMASLSKPAGDAIALKQKLEANDWRVKCLSDRVDGKTLEAALTEFLERLAVGQDALIYFTGHGFMVEESEDDRRGYLATSDCTIEVEAEKIVSQRRGLSFSRLNGLIQRARLSSLVVLLDCCHGGLFVEDGLVKRSLKAEADQNFCWIAACRSFQQSYARKSEAHSLFTGALLEALAEGQAENGEVTVLSVLRFVNAAFKQLQMQEPIYIGAGKDIPLIRYGQRVVEPTRIREENPYQGLLAFTPATKQFFFGRDRVVDDLVLKLEDGNFVPLIGASGSGKSSVVRAGLVPRLEGLGWRVLEPIVPGTDPMWALRSLTAGLYEGDVMTPDGGVRPRIAGDGRILLVVDQFEEVFTLCRSPQERVQFIEALLALAGDLDRVAIVVTMRADFVEACLVHEALTQVIQRDAVYLGALTGSDLEEAIEQPAIVQGASLQPKLLAQILQDVASEPNCLPLLEFALTQLWEKRSDRVLTLAAYRQLGGVAGSLNAHAEAIYKQLATQKREDWAKQVLLKLVRTGEGNKDTRQRQRKVDLLAMGKDSLEREAIESVIATLVDGRLLVSDRVDDQDAIDLSHEALMTSWERLVGWREVDRETRRLVDKIEDAQREWQANHQKRKYLLEGRLLKDARRLLKARPEIVLGVKGFIQKSTWWRRTQLAGLLVIPTLVLGIPAEYLWREESIKRDYVRIEQLGNGVQGERDAVLNLVGGCWAKQQFSVTLHRQFDLLEYLNYLEIFLNYFRERAFGNCRSLQNAKLDKADLRFASLDGADLKSANLSSANLKEVNLSGANLVSANLSNAYLGLANLSSANLISVNLSGANLVSANLSNANFWDANLSSANLGETNLSNVFLRFSNLSNAYLGSANLSGADLSSANLSDANLVSVNLSNSNLSSANLSSASLGTANLHHANLSAANFWNASLWDANLSNASLEGTNLSGASLITSNLQNVKFGCLENRNDKNQWIKQCSNLKDIYWAQTNWNGIQGWESVENIPHALKQQLGLKAWRKDVREKIEQGKKPTGRSRK
ncbi:pentapeptide repeat-containing protein [Alkalinema pantanalense CENA528]|uniref:nSTAND1 domain-containing NTPase n=1 Tax=Alkalinema pantanalense TaxID=1620705 RepID=UPI003D6F58C4